MKLHYFCLTRTQTKRVKTLYCLIELHIIGVGIRDNYRHSGVKVYYLFSLLFNLLLNFDTSRLLLYSNTEQAACSGKKKILCAILIPNISNA